MKTEGWSGWGVAAPRSKNLLNVLHCTVLPCKAVGWFNLDIFCAPLPANCTWPMGKESLGNVSHPLVVSTWHGKYTHDIKIMPRTTVRCMTKYTAHTVHTCIHTKRPASSTVKPLGTTPLLIGTIGTVFFSSASTQRDTDVVISCPDSPSICSRGVCVRFDALKEMGFRTFDLPSGGQADDNLKCNDAPVAIVSTDGSVIP